MKSTLQDLKSVRRPEKINKTKTETSLPISSTKYCPIFKRKTNRDPYFWNCSKNTLQKMDGLWSVFTYIRAWLKGRSATMLTKKLWRCSWKFMIQNTAFTAKKSRSFTIKFRESLFFTFWTQKPKLQHWHLRGWIVPKNLFTSKPRDNLQRDSDKFTDFTDLHYNNPRRSVRIYITINTIW